MGDRSMAYVSKCRQCNGVISLQVDDPDRADDVARHVASEIRLGAYIERVSVETARGTREWCVCEECA